MISDSSRSEQVVEEYKKHKLAISAMRKIQSLIEGFEAGREADIRIAAIGLIVIFVTMALVTFFFFGMDKIMFLSALNTCLLKFCQ